MTSIHEQIVTTMNNSAITQAQQKLNSATSYNTSSSSIQSQQFLQLLTEQLKYQDPTNPMDNSEMLAQEAQFSTLEQMEALQSGFSEFANIYKANSLVGQIVEVQSDSGTVSGKVNYVDFSDASGASVNINGKNYPLSAVSKVYPQESSESSSSKIDSIKDAISTIGDNVEKVTKAVTEFISIF